MTQMQDVVGRILSELQTAIDFKLIVLVHERTGDPMPETMHPADLRVWAAKYSDRLIKRTQDGVEWLSEFWLDGKPLLRIWPARLVLDDAYVLRAHQKLEALS